MSACRSKWLSGWRDASAYERAAIAWASSVAGASSPQTAGIFFGTWKLGGILLSMSVLYGDDGIKHRLQDSQSKVLVTDSANAGRFDTALVERMSPGVVAIGDGKQTLGSGFGIGPGLALTAAHVAKAAGAAPVADCSQPIGGCDGNPVLEGSRYGSLRNPVRVVVPSGLPGQFPPTATLKMKKYFS